MALDVSAAGFDIKRWNKDTVYLQNMQLIKSDGVITFHHNHNEIDDFEEIIEIVSNTDAIYLEWVSIETREYHYYNLKHVLTELQTCNISIALLSKNTVHNAAIKDIHLAKHDTLILSPMRSLYPLDTDYSLIGEYNGGALYLGKWPTFSFLKNQQISCIFNCTKSPYYESAVLNVNEILFDVDTWKYALIDELEAQNNSIHSKYFKRLDKAIDKIHECMTNEHSNALLVHCHAGMHRAPFIIGCYLIKYGGDIFGKDTVQSIYSFIKSKRKIAQEFDYDWTLVRYKEYIHARRQPIDSCCCVM
eukprot:102165_1